MTLVNQFGQVSLLHELTGGQRYRRYRYTSYLALFSAGDQFPNSAQYIPASTHMTIEGSPWRLRAACAAAARPPAHSCDLASRRPLARAPLYRSLSRPAWLRGVLEAADAPRP